jgi:hypothetical protein
MAKVSQKLTPTEARQGSPRRMNLRVLIGSLTLMLIAGLLFYVMWPAAPEGASSQQQQGELR